MYILLLINYVYIDSQTQTWNVWSLQNIKVDKRMKDTRNAILNLKYNAISSAVGTLFENLIQSITDYGWGGIYSILS